MRVLKIHPLELYRQDSLSELITPCITPTHDIKLYSRAGRDPHGAVVLHAGLKPPPMKCDIRVFI